VCYLSTGEELFSQKAQFPVAHTLLSRLVAAKAGITLAGYIRSAGSSRWTPVMGGNLFCARLRSPSVPSSLDIRAISFLGKDQQHERWRCRLLEAPFRAAASPSDRSGKDCPDERPKVLGSESGTFRLGDKVRYFFNVRNQHGREPYDLREPNLYLPARCLLRSPSEPLRYREPVDHFH
jgi:hypothetical protein